VPSPTAHYVRKPKKSRGGPLCPLPRARARPLVYSCNVIFRTPRRRVNLNAPTIITNTIIHHRWRRRTLHYPPTLDHPLRSIHTHTHSHRRHRHVFSENLFPSYRVFFGERYIRAARRRRSFCRPKPIGACGDGGGGDGPLLFAATVHSGPDVSTVQPTPSRPRRSRRRRVIVTRVCM